MHCFRGAKCKKARLGAKASKDKAYAFKREKEYSVLCAAMDWSDRSKLLAHLALLVVAVIYGTNYSVAKDVMPEFLLPRAFILVRVLGATVLFHLVALFFRSEKIAVKDWGRIALAAAFGVAANQLLFFEGLNLTTPIPASVIMTTNPIMVLVLSAIILKVPIRPPRVLGILIGLSGALLLISRGEDLSTVFDRGKSLGNLLVFANAASYGAYLIVVKPLMRKYKALTVIRWVFTIGLLYVVPFGWPQLQEANPSSFPPTIWTEIAFVVIGTTFLAYLLNVYALKTVASTTVSFYIYLQPFFATLVAIYLGEDQLTWIILASALLIFLGVYLVSFYRRSVA